MQACYAPHASSAISSPYSLWGIGHYGQPCSPAPCGAQPSPVGPTLRGGEVGPDPTMCWGQRVAQPQVGTRGKGAWSSSDPGTWEGGMAQPRPGCSMGHMP